MSQQGLTLAIGGDDTIQIDQQVISTLANQDPGMLEFANDIAAAEQGKNGSVVYAQNNLGFMCDLVLRVTLAGLDDKYLNSRLQQQITGFSSFPVLSGVFTKRVGDGKSNISTVVYQLSGGVFLKGIPARVSARGDTEQSVSIWTMRFGLWQRLVQ